jgi:hypothetical protein
MAYEGLPPEDGLTVAERRLLETARAIASGPERPTAPYLLDIETQERILLFAAELGAQAEDHLYKAVRAQRGVNAWWTPERVARISGVPLDRRPKLEDIIRDLLPRILPSKDLTNESPAEEIDSALTATFSVLRAPSVLNTLDVLATYRAAAQNAKRQAADLDAFEGIALVLAPGLRKSRSRGRKPPAGYDKRRFDEYSMILYSTCRASAQHERSVRYALQWLARERERTRDDRRVSPNDIQEAMARLSGLRGPRWARRVRFGRGSLTLNEEAALKWLTEERARVGDPRPVGEGDIDRATAAVRNLRKRIKSRRKTLPAPEVR